MREQRREGARLTGERAEAAGPPLPDHTATLGRLVARLVARLAAQSDDALDDIVRSALATLGTQCDVEQAYVCATEDGERLTCTHHWNAHADPAPAIPGVPAEVAIRWWPRLAAGLPVCLPDVRALADERTSSVLGDGGVRSFLAVPLRDAGRLTGALAFASLRAPRAWTRAEIDLLQAVADTLAMARSREEAEAVRSRGERRAHALTAHGSELVVVIGPDGTVAGAGPTTRRVLGWEPNNLLGRSAHDLVAEPDRDTFANRLVTLVDRPGEPTRLPDLRMVHADGSVRWMELTVTNLLGEPAVHGMVVNAHDVTERVRAEAALTHQALHDPLTGLPNRGLLLDRLSHALERAQRARREVVVLFADLDDFQLVNQSLGHTAGDTVLIEVAGRLQAVVRAADTVARFGGDQFVVVAEDAAVGDHAVDRLASTVTEELRRPFVVGGRSCYLSASIGVARGSADVTAERLLAEADAGRRDAKERGHDRIALVDGDRRDETLRRLQLVDALHHAVARGELRLEYQAVVELDSGRVVGAEALVRWQRPFEPPLGPSEFIPVAEETGLIAPVGAWVLDEALHQVVAWERARPAAAPLRVLVNVSARQLDSGDFVETVAGLLASAGARPEQLCLEVTEGVLQQQPDHTRTVLRDLRALGVGIAIDDFGTGYSSLAEFRDLPIDAVKIDRRLVAGVEHDRRDAAVVSAAVRLARDLDLEPHAEGVETVAQQHRVHELGCALAQGYLLHRPAPPEELLPLLAPDPTHRP
ncbi:putative bifunctional diguanylate cyclase/phosphodiesterase [Egibacter rhizosphaerae]|uniref:putative bifunctional diguanylate cyclase/phosphodiesterase n=1 Tax=Egibacter rhizosphaerae TaxID=1670831 RepID=UPI0013F16788|nr:EAL domain-containing protein [Egibacter rhizosphaerae]